MSVRLAIVVSHPIQYQAPWFREIARLPGMELEVLFGHKASPAEQAASGFGVEFDWDVPVLEGYAHRFLRNSAKVPSVNNFAGVDTPEVGQLLREGKFDAVLVSGWHTRGYWQAIRACWSAGIPVMVRSDSHMRDKRPWWTNAAKWVPYRYFIGRMDGCLAAGEWSREYFLHYGARPERVFTVPHCVDVPVASADAGALRAEFRRRHGIADDATVFLLAGKLIARKRPFDFVRALAVSGSGVHGLVAGDGPLLEETRRLAGELGVKVSFPGFLNQHAISGAYAAADALVLPSTQDTWGLVVNEAMAWGLPCIVSDMVGCGPDLVSNGETGFVVPACDVEALAASMVTMASDPTARVQMADAARCRIAGHSPRMAALAIEVAVRGVLAGR